MTDTPSNYAPKLPCSRSSRQHRSMAEATTQPNAILKPSAMKAWKVVLALAAALMAFVAVVYAQRPFRVYQPLEGYDDIPLPPDYQEPAEWVFGRLMYPPHPESMFTRRYFRGRRAGVGYPRRHQLDSGLSSRRPPLRLGCPPSHPHQRAFGRTAHQSERWRRCL